MPEIIFAFLVDLTIGDPFYSWHPVRLMGRAIEWGEVMLRNSFFLQQSARHRNGAWHLLSDEKIAGGILAFAIPLTVFCLSWAVIKILTGIHPLLGFAASVYGIYAALSIRDLQKESGQVLRDLEEGRLQDARKNVGRIVGRDTESLDEKEVLRAAVEAVSESTVDGIIAPLFYAALGGAPLALAYKAVNTLDSMIGHQNERYRHFGFVAAKQDELWNWIPARLSVIFTSLAVFILGGRTQKSWSMGWKQGLAGAGSNSHYPEAAFAGALGVRLGGASTYQGRIVEKPYLGIAEKELETADLRKSLQLMMVVSWVTLGSMLLVKFL